MKLFTSLLLFLSCFVLQAQDFSAVDQKVDTYPKHYASAEGLASQIAKDFTTESDKARAIFTWLAKNITYDLQRFYQGNTKVNFSYTDQADFQRKLAAVNAHSVNETLRTNKAVCEGYARTYKKVAELLNIPCLFIGGYSKAAINDIGNIPPQEDHAWNAIKIGNTWKLVDVTWGAGHSENKQWKPFFDDYFFFTNPNEFALTHLPADKEFSFTDKKVGLKEFYGTPLFSKAFFKNKLQLEAPNQGKLVAASGSTIDFKMGLIPEGVTLHYAFRDTMRPQVIEPVCSGSSCSFSIPFSQTNNTELFIIANRKTALHYKVQVKK